MPFGSESFDSCNERDEATIRLVVRGSESQAQAIEAVIDTGFNGLLTLLPTLVYRACQMSSAMPLVMPACRQIELNVPWGMLRLFLGTITTRFRS